MTGKERAADDLVTITIDDREVSVPRGTNLIEAAQRLSIEIPHYCYHPCLSVVGNCRMCQVEVAGMPKLMIACHTVVQPGMQVRTHLTSQAVREAQAAALEFILINHPLDCTVCDQSGHCKLQDYHFAYSAKASRFREEKEHKPKAEPLGPTVMLDAERCIMCTRCIRFCDEITKTAELGMLQRGDRSVIAVDAGRPLDNPFSGNVVDLCPVGALTHRKWRFNTRIWFTRQVDTICPGCSTGCSCRTASRDGRVVLVKGRWSGDVNKEWLCDEGRYGFDRFLPAQRLRAPMLRGAESDWAGALGEVERLKGRIVLVLVAPDLMLEEYALIKRYLERFHKNAHVAVAYRERELSPLERMLISPDYAANFRGAQFAGLCGEEPEKHYLDCLAKLKNKVYQGLLVIGDRAVARADADLGLCEACAAVELSAGVLTDAEGPLAPALKVVLPGRSILEGSGLMINRGRRLQYAQRVLDPPSGVLAVWEIVNRLMERAGAGFTSAGSDREFTLAYLATEPRLAGIKIGTVPSVPIYLEDRWR